MNYINVYKYPAYSNLTLDAVADSDITKAIMKEAQSMVGNEKLVIDFYRNNTRALEGLRIKTLESKVVDFVIDNVNRNEITISVEEFNKL